MHRIMLESALHSENSFVTLTYSELEVPYGRCGLPTLMPSDLQKWLKRFRAAIAPLKIRFYACGEYGEVTERPHYHLAVFGFGACAYGRSRYSKSKSNCCVRCDLVRDTWGLGNVFISGLGKESAEYIAGYVMKKMTSVEDPRLEGRLPEFSRMSLRPGIGGDSVGGIATALAGVNYGADVPAGLRHGRSVLPLGRYLRRRLRLALGREVGEPREVSLERSKELLPLYAVNIADPSVSVKKQVIDMDLGRMVQVEARSRMFKKRKWV